jgi:hypothetical protein
MTHTDSFTVRCGYCDGTHTASTEIAPYGGTEHYGWTIYGVHCDATGTRYGVTAKTNTRITEEA